MSTMEQRMIGPYEAADLLKFNTSNRPLKRAHLDQLTRDMREGQWKDTGTPIVLSRIGQDTVLEDGQHRLTAIIAAGVTLPTWISTVNEHVYAYIDTGKIRSLRDIASVAAPSVLPSIVAAAANANAVLSHWIAQNYYAYHRLTKHERIELLLACPDQNAAVEIVRRQRSALRRNHTLGKQAAVLALYRAIGSEAMTFIERAYSDEMHTKGDPAYTLHRYLVAKNPENNKILTDYEAVIRCWNAHAEGRTLAFLNLKGTPPAVSHPRTDAASIAAD